MYQFNQRFHGRGRPARAGIPLFQIPPPPPMQVQFTPPLGPPLNSVGYFNPPIPARRVVTVPFYGEGYPPTRNRPDFQNQQHIRYHENASTSASVVRTGTKRHSDDQSDRSNKRIRGEPPDESSLTQIQDTSTTKIQDVPAPPPDYSKNSSITQAIVENFIEQHQSEATYNRKLLLRDAIHTVLSGLLPNCGLYIVGSSMSGFSTNSSDMDLCLVVSNQPVDQKRVAVDFLFLLARALSRCSFLSDFYVVKAIVPILKLHDSIGDIEVDLNINNIVGIRNTHLLKYYMLSDWRVRPLILFVKRWARFHDINDASKQTLSSYSLSLMLIHYLQCGVTPPVLPVLQKMYPDLFTDDQDIRNLRFNADVDFKSENQQSLGDLFLGFLSYYSNSFDYSTDCASVRKGLKIKKPNYRRACFAIEEPFDLSNTARSCFEARTFERVKRVFRVSYKRLNEKREVECLFIHPF